MKPTFKQLNTNIQDLKIGNGLYKSGEFNPSIKQTAFFRIKLKLLVATIFIASTISAQSLWEFVRTPDTRFENLEGYDFKPNYKTIDGLRMHYVDEGSKDSSVVVLLHGEPSWSYLYRNMIKCLVADGFRVIAPDLIGFGRSDKLTKQSDYTYKRQVEWTKTLLLDSLKLDHINLFVQDWGGLIGLRILAENPEKFTKVAAANTALPTGDSIFVVGDDFNVWQNFAQNSPNFDIGQFIQKNTFRQLSIREVEAYNAPFPDETYKKGARQMPQLVPTSPNDPASVDNRKAWEVLSHLQIPFLTLYSELNTVGQEFEKYFQDIIPGAKNQPHKLLKDGKHFLQEDNTAELSEILTKYFKSQSIVSHDIASIDTLKQIAATFPAMPKGSSGLISFVKGAPTFGSGAPFNDIEYTAINVDYIDGENGGGDLFMPVNPSEKFPGSNTVKVVKCVLNTDLNENYNAANRDRIILGTAEHPYPFFLKGDDGIDNDYVSIIHFDYENGAIQLKGTANDYTLVYCDSTDNVKTEGWYLFYTANFNIDLIAFIFPCNVIEPGISGNPPKNSNPLCNLTNTLSLDNPNQFQFATPIATTPGISEAIAQIGTNGKEIVAGMTVDKELNSYLVGHTDGDISGNNPSSSKVFVTKINPAGSTIWTYTLNMKQGTLLMDAKADETYLYACGRTLGNLPGFTNAGKWDGIILKIDKQTGQLVASNQWGNAGIDGYGNIEFDDNGNLFVSGQGSPFGVSGTDSEYLVAKHSKSDLSNVWRSLKGINATGFSASAEAWGGLTYKGSGTPGQGKLVAAGWYMGAGGANAFLSVYDNLHLSSPTRPYSITINSPGGITADWILDNTIDSQGNIYVAGYTTGNMQGTHKGEGDAYITKYSPTLTNPITKQFGTNKSDLIRKLEIDNNGNLYAIGYTYGNYNGHLNSDPTLQTGDILVQKFDQNLNFLDSKQFGTPHEERSYGAINNNVLFIGGLTEGAIKKTNSGSFDGYVLALNTTDLSYNSNPVTSVSTAILKDHINFYPNPTSGFVVFAISDMKSYDFSVINQLGQHLQTGQLNSAVKSISLSNYQNGIYFITLRNQQDITTIKVIKR